MRTYRALVARGTGPAGWEDVDQEELGDGDVEVEVIYSSLNYKDGLAVTGTGKVARRFPMVCGIDLAGVVSASGHPQWQVGDEVVATGWGLSETHPGGYAQRACLPGDWLMRRPTFLTLAQTMAVGTAGLTSALCVSAIEGSGVVPGDGEVLVTGAAGGVGSVAVALLSSLGYAVAASTGRPEAHDYLRSLGAATIVERGNLAGEGDGAGEGGRGPRPLEHERWSGAIDTVGGSTLATVLRQTRYGAAVAACGLAGGSALATTVLPFILRGVSLLGIDSVMCPTPRREQAWARLASSLPLGALDSITTVEPLARVPQLAEDILAGRIRGRVVIEVAGG